MMERTTPAYSVRRLDSRRWLWALWSSERDCLGPATAHGVEPTREQAVLRARELMGPRGRALSPVYAEKHSREYYVAQMNEDVPGHSVCACGKDRWFWTAWRKEPRNDPRHQDILPSLKWAETPFAYGYAATWKEARQAAFNAAGESCVGRPAKCAADYHRRLAEERRSERLAANPIDQEDAAVIEFLYTSGWRGRRPHRIIKKTLKRVFVHPHPYGNEKPRRPLIVLDRFELEGKGHASNPARRITFYVKPPDEQQHIPRCLEILGLQQPCTVAEVKRAFRRLAKDAHPDRGGTKEAFIAIRRAYEEVLVLLGHAA
jgi:DnaJ domain